MKISKDAKIAVFVVSLLVIDQLIKILVKTNMQIGEEISVIGNWFRLLFIENNGFAFGMQLGGNVGKFILSAGRIAIIVALAIYIRTLVRRENTPTGVLVGLSLILAGAIGNIIDCVFYGWIFGYAPIMFGRVVDMFYFPVIDTTLPSGFPFWGGRHIIFFRPIFNFADSCITCGAIYIVLFKWRFFAASGKTESAEK